MRSITNFRMTLIGFFAIALFFEAQAQSNVDTTRVRQINQVEGALPADLVLTPFFANISFTRPLLMLQAPGESSRFFVLEQRYTNSAPQLGRVRVIKNGVVQASAFIEVPVSTSDEQGLLGMAFHPDFANNRQVFVSYTDPNGDTTVVRFLTDINNPDVLDTSTRQVILRAYQPFSNHNGGMIAFGPDGYLYIGLGDGGSANDPNDFAENLTIPAPGCAPDTAYTNSPDGGIAASCTLLGKMLRIDINATTPAGTAGICGFGGAAQTGVIPYAIPASGNLVDGVSTTCKESWGYGLRNPWRFSFDRSNGELWIADVGQGAREEVNFVATGTNRFHFGWDSCEGLSLREGGGGVDCTLGTGLTLPPASGVVVKVPVTEYPHNTESNFEPGPLNTTPRTRCSITGGYRYRGPIAGLQGFYIYGDYCTGEIFCADAQANGSVSSFVQCPSSGPGGLLEVDANPALGNLGLVSFSEDNQGNVFVLNRSGSIFRIDSAGASQDPIFSNGFE